MNKDQRSFFIYVHDDLSQDPDWKKVGKSMTPHSAVRARQKYCSKKVSLNHLYFGDPAHIDFLEKEFKEEYRSPYCTSKFIIPRGVSETDIGVEFYCEPSIILIDS